MKIIKIMTVLIISCMVLDACGERTSEEQELQVLSFQGENELFYIRNGVIVLSPEKRVRCPEMAY